jgi:hypothetical protein
MLGDPLISSAAVALRLFGVRRQAAEAPPPLERDGGEVVDERCSPAVRREPPTSADLEVLDADCFGGGGDSDRK